MCINTEQTEEQQVQNKKNCQRVRERERERNAHRHFMQNVSINFINSATSYLDACTGIRPAQHQMANGKKNVCTSMGVK